MHSDKAMYNKTYFFVCLLCFLIHFLKIEFAIKLYLESLKSAIKEVHKNIDYITA